MTKQEIEALEGLINFDNDLDLKIGIQLSKSLKRINTCDNHYVNYHRYSSIITLLALSLNPGRISPIISKVNTSIYIDFENHRKIKSIEIKGLLVELYTGNVFIKYHVDGREYGNSIPLGTVLDWGVYINEGNVDGREVINEIIDLLITCLNSGEGLTYKIL